MLFLSVGMMYEFSRKFLKLQLQDFMSPGMSFFKKIHFDVVQCYGTCIRLGLCATWAAVGTRLQFWDPLSLLATLTSHMDGYHAFAGSPTHIPAGCRTAGPVCATSSRGYKKYRVIQRVLVTQLFPMTCERKDTGLDILVAVG